MLFLVGFISLIIMIIIGLIRTAQREKNNDEFFFFSALKWIIAGWTILAISCYIMVLQDGDGDENALFWVSIAFTLGTIACIIAEKISISNNLRKKKIEEYKKEKKDIWE